MAPIDTKQTRLTAGRIILFILGLLVCTLGDSMNFKADIGMTPYEATQLTANYITGIRVGTLAMISNFLLLGGQLLVRRRFTPGMLIQIPLCIVQGQLLNLIIYVLFGRLTLSYPMRVVFLLSGTLLAATGVGAMVHADVGVFPLEAFCKALSDARGFNFARVRQGADILFVALCLAVSLIFRLPFAIREGTIASALIFSPVMSLAMRLMQRLRAR